MTCFAALVQIEGTLRQGQVNSHLVKVVLDCLKKDPEERMTAAGVLAALDKFLYQKRW